jgi:hypothetical protein
VSYVTKEGAGSGADAVQWLSSRYGSAWADPDAGESGRVRPQKTRNTRRSAMTTKSAAEAANAAHFAAEDAARAAVIADRLFDLGVPTDPLGAAAWHERAAGQARLEAGRQDVARIVELAAAAERDAIQDRVDQVERDRARGAELLANIDAALADVTEQEHREQAAAVVTELAETAKRLADTVDQALRVAHYRKATNLPLTRGQVKLLEQYGSS